MRQHGMIHFYLYLLHLYVDNKLFLMLDFNIKQQKSNLREKLFNTFQRNRCVVHLAHMTRSSVQFYVQTF